MIHLFLDADDYLLSQRLAELKRAMGPPEMADLNLAELEGPRVSAGEILGQASAMPFLAERRLVVVRGYLAHLDRRMAASKGTENAAYDEAAQLLLGVADLPDSSDIALIDPSPDKRRHLWKGYQQQITAKDGSKTERKVPGLADLIKARQVVAEELATPDPRQLPAWITRTAKAQGVEIQGQAIQMLANFVGGDLRRLSNELDKLAAYARGRAITPEDVRLLVSDASEAIIWELTDAMSQRNGGKAMTALYELRQNDANPFYLLTMIARQYRILIKVKEAMSRHRGNEYDLAKVVGESPFPVKKAMNQAGNYQMAELETILGRLLAADVAMKTGADPETEIDVLVAELTQRARIRDNSL